MAINVYGWRKPTLELELVEGGSLLANTKYYVCGVMKYCPFVYAAVGSQLSDIYTITTTTTSRSIKITQKTFRDITSFASGGTNITTCTSQKHCLKTGDQIKISSGSYIGTWAITKVDANIFTIPTAYIDNIAVQCYTDSAYYNKPNELGPYSYSNYIQMSYYVSTLNPILGELWVGGNNWTSSSYQNNNSTNPTILTAQPSQNFTGGNCDLSVVKIASGMLNYAKINGTIYVAISETEHTIQDIYDAIVGAGFSDNCFYNATAKAFGIVGTIFCTTTGKLSALTGWNLTIINGELLCYNESYIDSINLTGCMINIIPQIVQFNYILTANKCVLYSNTAGVSTPIYGKLYGTNNYVAAPATFKTDSVLTIKNLYDNTNITGILIENKIFLYAGQSSAVQQHSYGQSRYFNCTLYPAYMIMINDAKGTQPDIYTFENCTINQLGSNLWHFRWYAYAPAQPYQHIFKFLNINTDDANNIKKCVNNSVINILALFYRRVKFYIKDQSGTNINNATVTITDSVGNTYSGTTDNSGYTYIDCLEQKTEWLTSDGTGYSHRPQFDTHYTNFTISISKEGYTTEFLKLTTLYQEGFYDTVVNMNLHGTSYSKSRLVNATA